MRMRQLAITSLITLCTTVAVPVLSSSPVYACSCAPSPAPQEALKASTAVFRGVVKQVQSNTTGKTVRFEATEVWKGQVGAIFEVGTPTDSAGCGVEFAQNKEYLVYATGKTTELSTNLCSRTTQVSDAAADLRALGAGQKIQTIGSSSSATTSSGATSSAPAKPATTKTTENQWFDYVNLGIGLINSAALLVIASYLLRRK
jgi:hypothetical protein